MQGRLHFKSEFQIDDLTVFSNYLKYSIELIFFPQRIYSLSSSDLEN